MPHEGYVSPANANCYMVGALQDNGRFRVRSVFWDASAAFLAKKDNETVRHGLVYVRTGDIGSVVASRRFINAKRKR